MSAAVVQLLAVGQADRKIIDAERGASIFTAPFQAHTPFSMECVELIGGQAEFDNTYTVEVLRSADLIGAMHLQVTLPPVVLSKTADRSVGFSWARDFGHKMIREVEVTIGSLRIDRHYGAWLAIWAQLTVPAEKRQCYGRMVGDSNMSKDAQTQRMFGKIAGATAGDFAASTTSATAGTMCGGDAGYLPGQILYVPLQFWFNRVPGLALPLVGLQYHQVRLTFVFESLAKLCGCSVKNTHASVAAAAAIPALTINGGALISSVGTTLAAGAVERIALTSAQISGTKIRLFATQYNLGKPERTAIAGNAREYLIEQVQSSTNESVNGTSQSIRVQLSHPIKFLAWTARPSAIAGNAADTHDFQSYPHATTTSIGAEAAYATHNSCLTEHVLFSNGVSNKTVDDRTKKCGFNPLLSVGLKYNSSDRFVARDGTYFNLVQPYEHFPSCPTDAGIMVYSFALRPCEQQPTGSANFSRLDQVTMIVNPRFTGAAAVTGGTDLISNIPASKANLELSYYAVNLNTFVVSQGLGGLMWAN